MKQLKLVVVPALTVAFCAATIAVAATVTGTPEPRRPVRDGPATTPSTVWAATTASSASPAATTINGGNGADTIDGDGSCPPRASPTRPTARERWSSGNDHDLGRQRPVTP